MKVDAIARALGSLENGAVILTRMLERWKVHPNKLLLRNCGASNLHQGRAQMTYALYDRMWVHFQV